MPDNMTPGSWEKAYAEGTAHWAESREPSLFAKDFVKELEWRKAKTILEIGCGNGRDSIYFAKKGFKVIAIDMAPSAVELAKANADKAGVGVDIKQANAENLTFGINSFDAVFSLSVLHSTNLPASISEVHRVLKYKGYAFIHIYGNTIFPGGKININISLDNYLSLLKEVGFSILDFYAEEENKADASGEKHTVYVAKLVGV